ncbi:MAG TPA: UvrD-helicase domain-containing protein, partial [Desulfatirhabdiaceae bacterium]|nr:UvrD-helicase domain-containing protein [Desulfatirhabdiaceae bacterium]
NPLAEITRQYQSIRSLWQNHQAEIMWMIETSMDALHARYYKREWLTAWQDTISTWLMPSMPMVPEVPPALFRLSHTELASKTKKGKKPPQHDFFDGCDRLIQSLDLLNEWFLKLKHDCFLFSRIELENRKARERILFFDDLIIRLDHALQKPGGNHLAHQIRLRFPAALIDEFQDTDPIQYRIFQALYRNSGNPFFMIGDPKQSIYGFRGADIFAYLKAVGDGSGQTHSLQINWRSEPGLIHAVNTLFQHRSNSFLFPRIQFHPVVPPLDTPACADRSRMSLDQLVSPLSITFIKNSAAGQHLDQKSGQITKDWMNRHLPGQIARDIGNILKYKVNFGMKSGAEADGTLSRPVTPGDIAVLVRTNRQAQAVQDALREASIPSVLESKETVWHSKEAEMLRHVLKAVADPQDPRQIVAALITDLFGLDAHDLWELGQDEIRWGDWVMHFRTWHVIWAHRGLIPMMNQMLGMRDSNQSVIPLVRLVGFPDGERRVSNVLHLTELLHQAAQDQRLEIPGLVEWFEEQQKTPHVNSESAELRLESDARAVKLATVHKSKGLEYPIVYCPYLWEGKRRPDSRFPILFHDREHQERMSLDLGSDQRDVHQTWAEEESLAESLRLLYVAVTRARPRCFIYTADVKGMETSALGYLLHQREPAGEGSPCHLNEDRIQKDLDRLIN